MGNGRYKSVHFQDANMVSLVEKFENRTLVLTTDVAKDTMYTGLADENGQVQRLVTWHNTDELEAFGRWVEALGADDIQLIIEPSGSYGDPLRAYAKTQGWEVRLVTPKRVHDAAEVFDGVPSLHDAKASWLLAKLHAEGLSDPWEVDDEPTRRLKAFIRVMTRYRKTKQRNRNKLEARLATHWPEVTTLLKLDSATLLALLERFGGPQKIAEHPDEARQLMRKVSQGFLAYRKIESIIESAHQTNGQPMLDAERQALADLAEQTDRVRKKERLWKRRVEEAIEGFEDVENVAEVVGKATAAVFRAKIGHFEDYPSPEALLKKFGLNLKEKSSGSHQGQLKITKRGPSEARSYLYWATLRQIKEEPIFKAWHQRKIQRDGGIRTKSVIALMRKLVKGLWHVARGDTFDPTKLFDVERLRLSHG